MLIHRGFYGEDNPKLLDKPTDNKELKLVNELLKETLAEDSQFWHNVVAGWKGVSEETTTGVHRPLPDGRKRRTSCSGNQC